MADATPPDSAAMVRAEVVHVLSILSGEDEASIKDTDHLFKNLKLGIDSRRAMAPGFQRIVRRHKADAVITRVECEKLITVGGSVTFVRKKGGV